jgi:hypothetical protein
VSNTRRHRTWAGRPLRLGSNPARARSLPRARVPQPGTPTAARPRSLPPGWADEASRVPFRIAVPDALLRPLRARRAPSSRSPSGS